MNSETSRLRSILGALLKLAAICAVLYGANRLVNWALSASQNVSPDTQRFLLIAILLVVLIGYALLLSLPFVPGVEIGISLLVMRGPELAPLVYAATVLGLWLGFFYGRYLPYSWIEKKLHDFRLERAGAFFARIQDLDPPERMNLLAERLPPWLGARLIKWRYLMIPVLIHIPGNIIIGGGGGICMIAGLSRIFGTPQTMLTIALSAAPFPLLVWFFGVDLISWMAPHHSH